MGCKIYLIRHGQSLGNLKDVFLGHTDLDLSDLGYRQAECTAVFLKDKGIDVIYSSDLLRAYNTSQALCRSLNKTAIKCENFREIFVGEWENKPFKYLVENYPETYSVWLNDIGRAKIDGGESVKELYDRISLALKNVAEKEDGKTVAIFTHATPIRVIRCLCEKVSLDNMKNIGWCSNASVSEVTYTDGVFNMTYYGKDDFLGDITTRLPSNV